MLFNQQYKHDDYCHGLVKAILKNILSLMLFNDKVILNQFKYQQSF
jgi:hypothetical protein